MKNQIMKWINFRYCYYLLLFNVATMGLGFLLFFVKNIPQAPVQVAGFSVGSLIGIYAYLGFIKYSYITEHNKFRKIMFVALCLSLIYFLIYIVKAATTVDLKNDKFYFIPAALEIPLLCYAFNLIKNEDSIYFKKLSRLYLYSLIVGSSVFIGYLVSLSFSYPFLILLPFILAGFVAVILIWYWKIKLFKHLATKYE
jgi:hypothetical protein